MELSIDNARRIREVMVNLRRQIKSKDATIAALRQVLEDCEEESEQKIAELRRELAELQYVSWTGCKERQIDPEASIGRALAQLRQMFPGAQIAVSYKREEVEA